MIEQHDTSAAARRAQRAVFRRLAPADRVALAIQMSEEARALAADGIRHRRPNVGEAEIETALRRLMLGDELADRVDGSR
jgi:hypothetical protein